MIERQQPVLLQAVTLLSAGNSGNVWQAAITFKAWIALCELVLTPV